MRRGVEVANAAVQGCLDRRRRLLVGNGAIEVAELGAAEGKLGELRYHRAIRALGRSTSRRTSSRRAVDVSPGVVMASAPWAAPYSTAAVRSPSSSRP